MGLVARQFTPLQYEKWHLFYTLVLRQERGELIEKEEIIKAALNRDLPAEDLWSHILWLLEGYGGNKEEVVKELLVLASTNNTEWAKDVIEVAIRHGVPGKETTAKGPLVWD